jgi:hypothetical protein
MTSSWRTAWQGQDIVVFRDEAEVDRINAEQIQRVVFVYAGTGESPGDLEYAIVDTPADCIVLPAETGFAGRVNFERTDYWAARGCVVWVPQARASLPLRLRRGRWLRLGSGPVYSRVSRGELAPLIDQWPLEGPQTWEQRKWRRIERSRPFTGRDDSVHKARVTQ